jgi:tryptophan-rich sensory protein
MALRIIAFLLINFGALAIGGLATSGGVVSYWAQNLNQAPWTPPGWVFGVAWTFVMLTYSVYMADLWPRVKNQKLLLALFSLQWLLNVAWNPIFFTLHEVLLALITISALTILIAAFVITYATASRSKTLLILPYFFWLLIATSLNAFIYLKN